MPPSIRQQFVNALFNPLLVDVENQLNFINAEHEDKIKRSEESAKIVSKAYEQLKQAALKRRFKNQSEEIQYFKTLISK